MFLRFRLLLYIYVICFLEPCAHCCTCKAEVCLTIFVVHCIRLYGAYIGTGGGQPSLTKFAVEQGWPSGLLPVTHGEVQQPVKEAAMTHAGGRVCGAGRACATVCAVSRPGDSCNCASCGIGYSGPLGWRPAIHCCIHRAHQGPGLP